MPVPRLRPALVVLAGLVLLLFLAGCIEHPLSPEESAAIKGGGSAAVLLRFVGQELEPFAGWDPSSQVQIAIGDFDSGGVPRWREVRTLGPTARDEGWLTLILPPGYHYLVFAKGTPSHMESLPRWRIEVPPGAPVIYAGTFHLSGIEGQRILRIDQAATTVEDETETAVQTARRDLPALPPPVTRLAVRHTGPILLGVPPSAQSSE